MTDSENVVEDAESPSADGAGGSVTIDLADLAYQSGRLLWVAS